ncbi:MAG TPA: hypothetical protein VLY04_01160 [Bryobacteraceae bacterium]|nr:hypothetical protein [Bryobacteraceae bacterium]
MALVCGRRAVLALVLALPGFVLNTANSSGLYANAGGPNRLYLNANARGGVPKLLVLVPPIGQRKVLGAVHVKNVEDADARAREVSALIVKALVRGGWQVDEDSFAGPSPPADAALRNAIAYVRERYAQMAVEMTAKPKDVTKGKFSFGPDISILGSGRKDRALLLVNDSSVKLTNFPIGVFVGGMRAGGMPGVTVSLVDPETGVVLCFVRAEDRREGALAKTFSKIPHRRIGDDR